MDNAGKSHAWTINSTHALIWEGRPWIPVGVRLTPRSLAEGSGEDEWKLDLADLQRLKARGILDVIIQPTRPGADIPVQSWQKLIDALEAASFRYGIGFGPGITTPLIGTLIKPAAFRKVDMSDTGEASWRVPGADSARFLYAEARDGTQILREGEIPVRDGLAAIPPGERPTSGAIALLYPHMQLQNSPDATLPNIWDGYDSWRDRVLETFKKIKFGPGLRFFLDPLTSHLGYPPDAQYLFPDSPIFRMEWEAFLTRQYASVDTLMNSWMVQDRDLQDIKQAARMIPLWSNSRGVNFLLDPTTKKRSAIRTSSSRFWDDLNACRDESVSYYLLAMATVLRRQIANVPIIYTRTAEHRIYQVNSRSEGIDGLGISAKGHGSLLVTGGADSTFSQCDGAGKQLWCPVLEMPDASTSATALNLKQDILMLRDAGARGFFVNDLNSDQEPWLTDIATKFEADNAIATTRPRILPFPSVAAGIVKAGMIAGTNVWWVPSLASGTQLQFGSSYVGYTLMQPGGAITVLWSLHGPRETRIRMENAKTLSVTQPDGTPVKIKTDLKHNTITLMMDENPLVFRTLGQDIFPEEAAYDALAQLKAMVDDGLARHLPVEQYKMAYDHAMTNLKLTSPRLACTTAAEAINGILPLVQPYIWREAEFADSHGFSELAPEPGASNQTLLSLNTVNQPGQAGYDAQYKIDIAQKDIYDLWVSCTPPGTNSSAFVWTIDAQPPHSVMDGKVVGSPYLVNKLVWINLGKVDLNAGQHTLTLKVTDRNAANDRYFLNIDAILLTRDSFIPRGILRPTLPIPDIKKGK